MMAIDEGRINTRRSYGLLAGVLIASVALGLIIWKVGDLGVQSIFYTIFAVTGAYLIIASFFQDARLDFAPSDSSFYLVTGTLLATVGALGFVDMFTDVDIWILVAVFVLVFAILITYRSVSRKG